MKKLLSICAIATVLLGCNNNKYEFEGKFPAKFEGKMAVIANYDDSVAIDSAIIADGKFVIKGEVETPTLVQVMIDGKTRAFAVLEPGKFAIADSSYVAVGTPINNRFMEEISQVDSIGTLDDMRMYLTAVEEKYNANKDDVTGVYFATELVRFSELPAIDSLLSVAPQQIKNSKRVQRYRNSAILRSATMPGKMFTDFEAIQPNGRKAKLSDYAGKGNYLLVDFWASWCPYCIKEIPELREMQSRFADKGFKILGVAVRDKAEDTQLAVEKYEIAWDVMYNTERVPYNIYGFTGIPHLMLIGSDGTIISRGESPKQITAYLEQVYQREEN